MRIAHTGDDHYCEKHLTWVDKAFSYFVEHAIQSKAEVGIIAGDLLDNMIHLHNPVVGIMVNRVLRLANHMPVFIIYGTPTHDRPGSLDLLHHLKAKYPIHVASKPGRFYLFESGWHRAESIDERDFRHIKLCINALPGVNRADYRAADAAAHMGETLGQMFSEWAPKNQALRRLGIPCVLVTHGEVNGCVTESKQAMVSQDWEFTTGTLFSAECSAVMINHIHAHQSWAKDGRRIAFPGSITKLVYGHDMPTGYLLWEVAPDTADFALIETPSRSLVDIEFDGPPDLQELQRRLTSCRDAYVRLRFQVDEEFRKSIDMQALKEMLAAAGVADFKIEPRVNPVQRTRAAGIHQAVTIADKLKRWCELTGVAETPLLQRLALLEAGQQPGGAA